MSTNGPHDFPLAPPGPGFADKPKRRLSGRGSRRKGATAERELFNLLNEKLGRQVFKRNLLQSRQGGADNEGETALAIEVKRCETLALPAWIKQAKEQAKPGQLPVVAYRRSGEEWQYLAVMDTDWLLAIYALIEGSNT